MKRTLCILLAMCISVVICSAAFAEAKLTVDQKKLITFEGDWKAYFFAKIENTGDSGTYLDYGGKLVGFDEDDNVVLTEEYVGAYPARLYLEPGEYAYVKEYILENELKTNNVVDYKYSLKQNDYGDDYDMLPCEATIEYSSTNTYDNYVYVTFTNTTESVLYGFAITTAIYDTNGELIFVDSDGSSAVGIHPQSTVTVKMRIDSDLVEYYTRNSVTPSTVDAMVYIMQ